MRYLSRDELVVVGLLDSAVAEMNVVSLQCKGR